MKRYHRLDVARKVTSDQRQYEVPQAMDTSRASETIQRLLERKALEGTKWGVGTLALRCKLCRAIYRHDTNDLTHCLCCGQPLITVDYTN